MKRISIGVLSVALPLAALGCGGGEAATEPEPTSTSGSERRRSVDDGAEITGLMGTIPRDQVENTLNPRMGRFERCLGTRMGDLEYLAGDIRLTFRIHIDGTVAWVYPAQTTFGDRATEQCILDIARQTRFPRPHGGEAEFSWGFGFDASEDVRPPLNWASDALGDRMGDVGDIARECNARGSFEITAYIQPGGAVLAAGGSAPDAQSEQALDCLLERVRGWEMPDPGSYPAKITFAVR